MSRASGSRCTFPAAWPRRISAWLPDSRRATVTANVIGVLENQAPTRHLTATLQVTGGVVQPDLGKDVLPLALVERHRGAGTVVNGFVHGLRVRGPVRRGLDRGA